MELSDLASRLRSGRLFHAYIVTGADAGTRERAGDLIAQAAVCEAERGVPCGVCRDCVKARKKIHPDIETVRRDPDQAFYNVETMRDLRTRALDVPNEAKRGVHIIADADLISEKAQNAILKVLEEPPAHAVFVLLADNPQMLLETVRSRCETVSLTPEETAPDGKIDGIAGEFFDALAREDGLGLVRAVKPMDKLTKTELFDLVSGLRRRALNAAGQMPEDKLKRLTDTLDTADQMVFSNLKGAALGGYLIARLYGSGE